MFYVDQMTWYTNPTNIFNYVPYYVILKEISPFLDACDRAAFNAVLEPTERVYKKFPPGFAVQHALRIAYGAQRHYVYMINYLSDRMFLVFRPEYERAAITVISLYADFLMKPVAAPLFVYGNSAKAKAKAVSDMRKFLAEDYIFEDSISDVMRTKIHKVITYIEGLT